MIKDTNNNVLVTASSHGLGHAIAKKFSENNHGIIIHGRDSKKIDEATSRLENVIDVVMGDLREEHTINLIEKCVKKHGISILVNNAAIPCYGLNLDKMSTKQIIESISVNLISPILLTQRLYSFLSRTENSGIININSIVGFESKKLRSVHSATKWGLRGFSKSLRIEASEDHVKVINVYPSRVRTVKEYTYGLDPEVVAETIYKNFWDKNFKDELLIDGRPEEFKPKIKYIL